MLKTSPRAELACHGGEACTAEETLTENTSGLSDCDILGSGSDEEVPDIRADEWPEECAGSRRCRSRSFVDEAEFDLLSNPGKAQACRAERTAVRSESGRNTDSTGGSGCQASSRQAKLFSSLPTIAEASMYAVMTRAGDRAVCESHDDESGASRSASLVRNRMRILGRRSAQIHGDVEAAVFSWTDQSSHSCHTQGCEAWLSRGLQRERGAQQTAGTDSGFQRAPDSLAH